MKKIITLLMISMTLIISGCSTKPIKDDAGESRKTEHFSIEVVQVKSEAALKENQLVTVDFKIKNTGDVDFAIGASDFYLKDSEGKEYKMNGDHPNFGDDVKKGATLEGKGYYQLPEKNSEFTVVYQPFKTVDGEWFMALPKK